MGPTIRDLIKRLIASYPYAKVSEDTVVMYYAGLRDLPSDELTVVINQCVREHKFLPTVAEILEMHYQLTAGLGKLTAGEAWKEVQRAITRYGRIRKPEFSDELVAEAVAVLGWRNLCISENQAADRARFLQVYDEISRRNEKVSRLTPDAKRLVERSNPKGLLHISKLLEDKANE